MQSRTQLAPGEAIACLKDEYHRHNAVKHTNLYQREAKFTPTDLVKASSSHIAYNIVYKNRRRHKREQHTLGKPEPEHMVITPEETPEASPERENVDVPMQIDPGRLVEVDRRIFPEMTLDGAGGRLVTIKERGDKWNELKKVCVWGARVTSTSRNIEARADGKELVLEPGMELCGMKVYQGVVKGKKVWILEVRKGAVTAGQMLEFRAITESGSREARFSYWENLVDAGEIVTTPRTSTTSTTISTTTSTTSTTTTTQATLDKPNLSELAVVIPIDTPSQIALDVSVGTVAVAEAHFKSAGSHGSGPVRPLREVEVPGQSVDDEDAFLSEGPAFKPMYKSVQKSSEKMWDRAIQNGWYKWALYTVKEMTDEECIICAKSPDTIPIVIPEKHTYDECAEIQRRGCVDGKWVRGEGHQGKYKPPMCGIECRLMYGSFLYEQFVAGPQSEIIDTTILGGLREAGKDCVRFGLSTSQKEPITNYRVDESGMYECFAAGQHYGLTAGVDVGNTTVNCITIWVYSWFPHSGRPRVNDSVLLDKYPIRFEQPEIKYQYCEDMAIGKPTYFYLIEQDRAIADSYWMCGDNILRNELPRLWVGLCALVRLKAEAVVMYEGVDEVINTGEAMRALRRKREVNAYAEIELNSIGVPVGIPDEFKAQDEVRAGLESILPWVQINKQVNWINYIYYNQQRYLNYTNEALSALGQQLHSTSLMAYQNRQILDFLLADKGGVCSMFGELCCTYIPNNTAPGGLFSEAMRKLHQLKTELKENAGENKILSLPDWLELNLGKWGAILAKAAIAAALLLILVFLLLFCIVPVVRRWCLRTVERQTDTVIGLQRAMMLSQLPPRQLVLLSPAIEGVNGGSGSGIAEPDLFPVPNYMDGSSDTVSPGNNGMRQLRY